MTLPYLVAMGCLLLTAVVFGGIMVWTHEGLDQC